MIAGSPRALEIPAAEKESPAIPMSRHRNAFLIPVLLVLVFASRVSSSEKVAVTWSPAGDDRVRFAASEFSGYAENLTGHGVSLTTEAGELADASIIVLICAVGKGARKGVFEVGARLEKDVPASEEGFLLRSQDSDGRKVLYIIGRTSRAATYGVYHYLEKYCASGSSRTLSSTFPRAVGSSSTR